MASSSTSGRPFIGRLRSSSRAGAAGQSKDAFGCTTPSISYTQYGSNEPIFHTRFSTLRTSSASVGAHEGGENVIALSRNAVCRAGTAPGARNSSAVEGEARPRPADKADATKETYGVKHRNDDDYGVRACSLVTDGRLGLRKSTATPPEDNRTARRRRRAEAAAAAAAAALESDRANETCGISREATADALPIAGAERTHTRRTSGRGHSGLEGRGGRHCRGSYIAEGRPWVPSAFSISDVPGGEPAQSLEPQGSLPTASAESAAGANSFKSKQGHSETSTELGFPVGDRMSSQTTEDLDAGSRALQSSGPTHAGHVKDAQCDVPSVVSSVDPQRSEVAGSGGCASGGTLNASKMETASTSDVTTTAAASAADASHAVRRTTDSEGGHDCDRPHVCGSDVGCLLKSFPASASSSPNIDCIAAQAVTRACPCDAATGQTDRNKTFQGGGGFPPANANRETPEEIKMSALSRCVDSSTTTTCSAGAKQAECSSGSHGGDACAVRASECLSGAGAAVGSLPLAHAPESRRASQGVSCSLKEDGKRQHAREEVPQEDGAQHDDGKRTSMPGPASPCTTNPAEAHQATVAGDTLPEAGATAVRHTETLRSPESGASSCTMEGFHLTPVLHGLECLRGELLLSKEEYEAMQVLLRPLFYRLVPSASPNECTFGFHEHSGRVHSTRGGVTQQASVMCSDVRDHTEGKPSSRRLAQELHALQQAACGFAALPLRGSKRRRGPQLKGSHDDEAEAGSATYSSSRSSGESFCSVGTHRRGHDGACEDGECSKRHVVLPVQEEGRRRPRSRARKLPLRLDEDAEGEEGFTDVFKRHRRSKRVRVSARVDVERTSVATSDDDAVSAVGGPSARRVRGTSSNSWRQMQSFDDAFGRPGILRKQQLVHGESQMGRGNILHEGRGGKGPCMEMHVYASTASSRGQGARSSHSRGHRRRLHLKQSDWAGSDRFEDDAFSGNAIEADASLPGNRRIRGARQKRRRGGIVSPGARSGESSSSTRYRVGSCGSTAGFGSSTSFQVSPTMGWRESCFQILQHLKRQPAARWFLSPDCDASGNAETPIQRVYLEDIEQKLTSSVPPHSITEAIAMSIETLAGAPAVCCSGGYVHPSQWQQEVRQIFFHAFALHPMYHEIWRDATILAAEFERCCRLVHQVNPYYPSMLKRQRCSGRASVSGGAGRPAERACVPETSAALTGSAAHSCPQLPVSGFVHERSPCATSLKSADSHSGAGGSHCMPSPGVAPYLHQTMSLVHPQQVQFSQSGSSAISHHLALRARGAPRAAVARADAFREGPAILTYAPKTPYPRGGGGKQPGEGRNKRTWEETGVRGKRQQQHQQHQQGLGMPEDRVVSEDVESVPRNPDNSLVYAYTGQYREAGVEIQGEEEGKCSRVLGTAMAVGSPRRGCRGGGRGRGNTRGGRGTGLGSKVRGSALIWGQLPWASVASQGTRMVPEQRFFGTLGELQQQPYISGGRMVPLGVVHGGQSAHDRGVVLVGAPGVPAITDFAGGQAMHATGGSADLLMLSSSNVLETLQQMDAPAGAPVLPPPPIPRIGVNDKPLSNSQRRTLEQNMQRLSPLQRKAALELIQDDLGILAAEYMNVKAFAFDTELLSIEKQKRLFAFVNSMSRANREILLRQQEELVAAAQASAMSAAADGATGALLQPTGARRGRRQRREGSLEGASGGVQSRSGSSSSSSGTDSDTSSSLSSSDTSSSSSSDSEEEEAEESETEGQKASAFTSDASSSAAQQGSVSGVNTEDASLQSMEDGSGRTGTGEATVNIVDESHDDALLTASGKWYRRGSSGGIIESDVKWKENRCTTSEGDSRHDCDVIDGVSCEKKDVNHSSGMLRLERAASVVKITSLTGTSSLNGDCLDIKPAAEGQVGTSGECARGRSTQGKTMGPCSGGSCSLLPMHGPPVESLSGSSAAALASPGQRSACSDVVSTQHPSAACCTVTAKAEIPGSHDSAVANGEQGGESFVDSYGSAPVPKPSGGGGRTLPQYTPVCEEGARVEISAEVMGRHADFLGVLAVREASTSENEVGRMEHAS